MSDRPTEKPSAAFVWAAFGEQYPSRLVHAKDVMARVRDYNLILNMLRWAFETPADVEPIDCNTAACFGGWCARDEVFRAQGLHWKYDRSPFGFDGWEIAYKDATAFDALCEFFDITPEQAYFLADPAKYGINPSPDEVIRRLDMVIAGYSPSIDDDGDDDAPVELDASVTRGVEDDDDDTEGEEC